MDHKDLNPLLNPTFHISFSRLALLDRSPFLFHKKYILGEEIEDKESTAMNLGSAVDCLLCQPDEFYNLFAVSTVEKPTGQMGDYVTALHYHIEKLVSQGESDVFEKAEQLAYQDAGFKRDSIDKVRERFNTEAKEYYNFLVSSKDKIVLSFEQLTKANAAVEVLKNNKFTRQFLAETLEQGIERFYQHESKFTHNDINYVVKLDVIIVDHKNMTIQPIDLKTTSESPYGFTKSMHKYRYDIQAVIYSHYISTEFVKEKGLEEYQILPFKFIVINVEYPNNPLIWKMSYNDIMVAKMGLAGDSNVKGFWDLIEDLKWHLTNDVWDYKREVYESNGELVTNMYDKTTI